MGKHTLNRLTAREVAGSKDRGHYPDGGGLYLRVGAAGTRSWVFRYTRQGKTREMGLGAVNDVTLAKARMLAAEARELLRGGAGPDRHAHGHAQRQARCIDRHVPAVRRALHRGQAGRLEKRQARRAVGRHADAVRLPDHRHAERGRRDPAARPENP